MWYFELEIDTQSEFLNALRRLIFNVAIYLEAVAKEFFSASKTRGGLVLLGLLGFITYLFGVVYWNETSTWSSGDSSPSWWVPNSNPAPCGTLNGCILIFLRFAFYDGNGFDFMTNMKNSGVMGISELAMLYMLVCGIIIFNGLIQVFGGAFSHAGSDSDSDSESSGDEDDYIEDEDEDEDDEALTLKNVVDIVNVIIAKRAVSNLPAAVPTSPRNDAV